MRMRTVLFIALPSLWLATLASAISILYVRHRARELTYQLSQERIRHERLELAWGQLQRLRPPLAPTHPRRQRP